MNVPGLTVADELIAGEMEPSVTSLAETVAEPAVLNVTLKALEPATNAASTGRVALGSLEEIEVVWVELTRFQLASTERTVILKAAPAV